jgi:hypothetical protein
MSGKPHATLAENENPDFEPHKMGPALGGEVRANW